MCSELDWCCPELDSVCGEIILYFSAIINSNSEIPPPKRNIFKFFFNSIHILNLILNQEISIHNI